MELKSRNVAIIIFIMHQNLKSALFTALYVELFTLTLWTGLFLQSTHVFRTDFLKPKEVLQELNTIKLSG